MASYSQQGRRPRIPSYHTLLRFDSAELGGHFISLVLAQVLNRQDEGVDRSRGRDERMRWRRNRHTERDEDRQQDERRERDESRERAGWSERAERRRRAEEISRVQRRQQAQERQRAEVEDFEESLRETEYQHNPGDGDDIGGEGETATVEGGTVTDAGDDTRGEQLTLDLWNTVIELSVEDERLVMRGRGHGAHGWQLRSRVEDGLRDLNLAADGFATS